MVNTVVDAMSHSIEGIISCRATEVTDALAVKGLSLIGSALDALGSGTLSEAQLSDVLLASTLGGMVIANTGTTALHAMGYALTWHHGIDHGRANGLLLGAYVNFVGRTRPDLTAKVYGPLGLHSSGGLSFVLERLLGKRENLPSSDAALFAEQTLKAKNMLNCATVPCKEDIMRIYSESFESMSALPDLAVQRHASAPSAVLSEYIPSSAFRVIPGRLKHVSPGHTEIPVEFELSAGFEAGIKLPVSWDGKVIGFVQDNDSLRVLFTGAMADGYARRRITLHDWGDAFLLTFENGTRDHEIERFVSAEEVKTLFRECRIQGESEDLR
jgi:hypothetical protein